MGEVTLSASAVEVAEGGSVEMRCEVDADPPPHTIAWRIKVGTLR